MVTEEPKEVPVAQKRREFHGREHHTGLKNHRCLHATEKISRPRTKRCTATWLTCRSLLCAIPNAVKALWQATRSETVGRVSADHFCKNLVSKRSERRLQLERMSHS